MGRGRSSRVENALEVDSPFDITAVSEIGVEVLDALISLQVTDGHGENVFRASKYLTVSSTKSVAGTPSSGRRKRELRAARFDDPVREARFESSDVTFVPARLVRGRTRV